MSKTQLYVPKKLKVGFNHRDDTYTKMLAYIIYYDDKNILRKKDSWESWCDKSIPSVEYDNIPTEGFVLNKNVGGKGSRYSWYSWDTRTAKIRVFDPRNFEFEITLENLLFILRECNCSKGKGLEGKFVYAWEGKDLILLPAECEDYKSAMSYTDLQSQSVKSKELIPGATYTTKKQVQLIYVGRFEYHEIPKVKEGEIPTKEQLKVPKKYVFWDTESKEYLYLDSLRTISVLASDTVSHDLSNLIDGYWKSKYGTKIVEFFFDDRKKYSKNYRLCQYFGIKEDDAYVEYYYYSMNSNNTNGIEHTHSTHKYHINNDMVYCEKSTRHTYKTKQLEREAIDRSYGYYRNSYNEDEKLKIIPWVPPNDVLIHVRLESGSIFPINGGKLYDVE